MRRHTRRTVPVDVFGATVRGPAHVANGLPNQDAWRQARIADHCVVVVSDGMGSKPHADVGSRAACRAVVDAVRVWRRHPLAGTEVLLGLVHLLWRARIAPLAQEDCACTCLFAAFAPDGAGVVAQLGDGLVAIDGSRGVSVLSSRGGEGFANETTGLGLTARLAAWRTDVLSQDSRSVLLCTDGISDDLMADKIPEFVGWLRGEVRTMREPQRRHFLVRSLREWPTPKHLDDKTIAMACIGPCASIRKP
jgi:hypothetical protein